MFVIAVEVGQSLLKLLEVTKVESWEELIGPSKKHL
jgi:hypothetical protein